MFDAMNPTILEDVLFSKPYFDANHLFVAFEENEIAGMALVGFAPNDDETDLDHQRPVLSRLMVDPSRDLEPTAKALLTSAVELAESKEAADIFYGSRFPHSPFFDGAYGGSIVPGVLELEPSLKKFLLSEGFVQSDQIEAFQISLNSFRSVVDRKQISAKRQFKLITQADPKPVSWYSACNFGKQNCVDFLLTDRKTGERCGNLCYWEIQPLSSMWGRRTAGLYFISIDEKLRRTGLATMLVGESLKQLLELGFACVEVQVPRSQVGLCSLFEKLGFENVGRGVQMKKVLK